MQVSKLPSDTITLICDDYLVQKTLQDSFKSVQCVFAPASMQRVMEDCTNGCGFDLVISFVAAEESCRPVRDCIEVLALLGTWVVVVTEIQEGSFGLDPPEADLLQKKRATLVVS